MVASWRPLSKQQHHQPRISKRWVAGRESLARVGEPRSGHSETSEHVVDSRHVDIGSGCAPERRVEASVPAIVHREKPAQVVPVRPDRLVGAFTKPGVLL